MSRIHGLARLAAHPRFVQRYWRIVGSVLGGWLLACWTLIPWSIRQAHAGAPILSRLLPSRERTPVEEYLESWASLYPQILYPAFTLALLVFLLLVVLRQPFRSGATRTDESVADAAGLGLRVVTAPRPVWAGSTVLLVGGWLGLLTGLGEAYYLGWNSFLLGRTTAGLRHLSLDSLWMAPIADMAAFTLVGTLIVWIGKWKPRVTSGTVVLSVFGFLLLHTWTMVTHRVWSWASALLVAGIAFRLARFVVPAADAFKPLIRSTTPWLCGITIGVASSVILSPVVAERRALAELPDPTPNAHSVLLIVLDTQRAGSTSLYASLYPGGRRTTPNLERWAESAVVFDRAIAPAPWTLPSHASMFTGRLNRELGTDFSLPLDDRFPTVAEALLTHGYLTAGFVANLGFGSDFFGLDRGFIRYRDQPRTIGMLFESSWLTRSHWHPVRKWLGIRQDVVRKRAEDVNREFLSWLAANQDRPFFAFLNYFDAHQPYLPPWPFDTLYRQGEQRRYYFHDRTAHDIRDYTAQDVEDLESAYDASIAYLDHQVGRLLDTLDLAGVLEKTFVVVTSDHGESFGEHGQLGHANSVYRSELHVPLLIRPPGGIRPGRRTGQVASLRHLAATILHLVGLDPVLPGKSLAASFVGSPSSIANGDRQAPEPAVSEFLTGWLSLVDDRYHYVRLPNGDEELYDYEADPEEAVNLADDPDLAEVLQGLREGLARVAGDSIR